MVHSHTVRLPLGALLIPAPCVAQARSLEFKQKAGGARVALDAFKHAQIMAAELSEAVAQREQLE